MALRRESDDRKEKKMCFEWNVMMNNKLCAKGKAQMDKGPSGEPFEIETSVGIAQLAMAHLEASCSFNVEICY